MKIKVLILKPRTTMRFTSARAISRSFIVNLAIFSAMDSASA